MTKKYILTKDQIESTVTTSEYPPSSTAVKTVTDGKVNIAQGVGEAGKVLIVGQDGNVTTGTPSSQVQVDWSQTTTTEVDYIKNKPFQSIGTGLTVSSGVLSADVQLHFQIFEELPTPSATYAQTIALILKEVTETGNIYDEFACVNKSSTETPEWAWEKIGSTVAQVEITQTAAGISINGTALQSGSSAQTGLISSTDWSTFNGKQDALTFDSTPTSGSTNPVTSGGVYTALTAKEDTANKVSAWSATVSNDKYPTEKLVKDSLDAKVDLVEGTVQIGKDTAGYYFNE